jgi:hypothetical protein
MSSQLLLIGHYERLPYNSGTMRSIYHIREYNVRRLSLVCMSFEFCYCRLTLATASIDSDISLT